MIATNSTGMRIAALLVALTCGPGVVAFAQGVTVTGKVVVYNSTGFTARPTAVWLTPYEARVGESTAVAPMHVVLKQKNKSFEPHLLVVTRGSLVDFPNLDPWFHNVFSLFEGKKFDLGLYEAGTSRTVHFDREGVSYIFCNIHPEMSAVVVVVSVPYFAVAGRTGDFAVGGVPPGRYTLHVWSEYASPAALASLSRELDIGGTSYSVGTVRITETENPKAQHKNKYGRDYEPPSPNNPIYAQP